MTLKDACWLCLWNHYGTALHGVAIRPSAKQLILFGSMSLKRGDLFRNIKTGQSIVFLGMVDDTPGGCYHFWHWKFKDTYFSVSGWEPEKWELVR